MPWRRKWQPTPVLLPGESQGRRSLIGYSPQSCKESDMTERIHFHWYLLSIHLHIVFLFKKKNSSNFNWRIIALQYCVDLCCISTCISQMYTYVPSLPSSTPSHPSQSTGFELPVSSPKSPLAIYFAYGNAHVSKLLSPFSSPGLNSLCPQVCSLCLHLHCRPEYTSKPLTSHFFVFLLTFLLSSC